MEPITKNPPIACQICNKKINDRFYDCKVSLGGWCDCCPACSSNYGIGLGTGKGQEYIKQDNGTFVLTKGGMTKKEMEE